MLKTRPLFIFILILVKMLSIELNADNHNTLSNSNSLYKPPKMINIAKISGKGTAGEKDSKKPVESFREIHKKGVEYYIAKNYSKALKEFKKLRLLKLNSATVYYNLGLTYRRLKNKQQALKAFIKTLSIRPDHPSANKMIDRTIPQVLKMPVIFYDYRCNNTNPNFEAKYTKTEGKFISIDKSKLVVYRGYPDKYTITKNTKVYGLGGEIKDGLLKLTNTPKGTNIKFQVDPKYPFKVTAIEDPSEEYQKGYTKENLEGQEGMLFEHLNKDQKPVLKTYRQNAINFRFNEWYYPSGIKGTDAEFVYDILNDRWQWKGLKRFEDRPREFTGKNFDPKDPMANVIIYDNMEFNLRRSKTITNKGLIKTIATYVFDQPDYFPLDNKGFKERKNAGNGSHNYSFAAELHTRFLYRGGEFFDFRCDDDLYLFVDGKLQIDHGGHLHETREEMIEMDKIPGLKKGETYSFDLFWVERQTKGSSLRIEGTFVFYEPEPIILGIVADRDTFIPGDEQVKFTMIGEEIKNKKWMIGIWDKDDNIIKTFRGRQKIKRVLEWDGKDKNGRLVEPDKHFNIIARGTFPSGYEWESNIVTVKSLKKLIIKPKIELKKGTKIVIRAIYFAPFSSQVSPSSKIALERIYNMLIEYPKVRLLVKGHVNPFSWTPERLLELSQERAEAVRQYLIDKGIDPGRLEAKGFGDTDPISDVDTKEARSLNRRTEFEVIE